MGISARNTRTLITIPRTLKKELEEIAREDGRTFSNLVTKILKEFVDKNTRK
jgi:metal-responsive CopG/Arc/MetJ family transcriptional regulator